METSSLLKLRSQLSSLSPPKRIIIAVVLIIGFYAWIVVGFGLFGRLKEISASQEVTTLEQIQQQ